MCRPWVRAGLDLSVRARRQPATLDDALAQLRNAGTVFVGPSASVAFGDYMTGANHVLPTGGLARSYSGLSTLDFVRWTTYQRVAPAAAARLAGDVGVFADAEGLPGHAAAARNGSAGPLRLGSSSVVILCTVQVGASLARAACNLR